MREALLVVVILAGAEAAALGASKPSPRGLEPAADAIAGEARVQPAGKLVLSRFDERSRRQKLDDMNAFEQAQARGDCPLLRLRCRSGTPPGPASPANEF